jgi:hypothetical protein
MHSTFPVLAVAIVIAAGPRHVAGQATDGPETQPAPPGTLSTLQRVIRHFDFEEAEVAPYEMPIHFYRHLATDEGFPPFGAVGLTSEAAFAGRWSFGFSLDGGSLAGRVPTGVLGVFPYTDYRISAQIRTLGLKHARARLVAYFNDVNGEPIPSSRAQSPLLRTRGAWTNAVVTLHGTYADVADLTVELQLLQPQQFRAADDASGGPVLSDVSGQAWFDDVRVKLAPRIDLTGASPTNVFFAPDRPTLNVAVHDLVKGDISARLTVRDVDGRFVAEFAFPLTHDRRPRTIALPLETNGWYDVRFEVHDGDGVAASAGTRIVLAPPPDAPDAPDAPRRQRRFALSFPHADAGHLAEDVAFAESLGFGALFIPAWSPSDRNGWPEALARQLDRLGRSDCEVVLTIHPPPAAQRGGAPFEAVAAHLDEIIALLSPAVSRWQLGETGDPHAEGVPAGEVVRFLAGARDSLEAMVTEPMITIARAASDEPVSGATDSVNVLVPYGIRPHDVAAVVGAWSSAAARVLLTYEPLPADRFSVRQRLTDLTLRALWGWRAGADLNIVPAPWRRNGASRSPQPDPALAVWSRLAHHLDEGTFGGELDFGDGVHCWIIERPAPQEAALVLWKDHAGPVDLESVLGGHRPLRLVDVFGNVIATDGPGGIDAAASLMPVFIEPVDLNLARLQRDFTIDPSFVPAVRRLHEHHVVLRNPWETTVSGKLTLPEISGLRFSPRTHSFDIPAGSTVRMPVALRFERDVPEASMIVEATIDLTADTHHAIVARTSLRTGSPVIDWDVSWYLAPNEETGRRDVVVRITVSNLGDEPANLNAMLVTEARHQQAPIAALAPGRTTTRTFVIPDGAATVAGTEIRATLAGRDSAVRLSRSFRVPRLNRELTTAVPEASGD